MFYLGWLPGLLLFAVPDPVDQFLADFVAVAPAGPVGPLAVAPAGPVGPLAIAPANPLFLPLPCPFLCPASVLMFVLPLLVLQLRKLALLYEDWVG